MEAKSIVGSCVGKLDSRASSGAVAESLQKMPNFQVIFDAARPTETTLKGSIIPNENGAAALDQTHRRLRAGARRDLCFRERVAIAEI